MRKNIRFLLRVSLLLPLVAFIPNRITDATYQSLPFAQNWTTTTLITADDNWAGVPGVIGYRGDAMTGATAVDPQTVVADGSATPVDVNANRNDPNTFATGGVTEFDGIANPVVALQGSGTGRAPHIVIHLNTTGLTNITVAYNLRDIDGSADNAVQPVALQYRVGGAGNYTNVPAGFIADATTGPSIATLVTAVSAVLPVACNNQAQVQLRIITTDAVGNDEWVGIDDINITGTTAAALNASLRDALLVDNNSNLILNPGDQLRYTTTIRNPTATDATGVNLNLGPATHSTENPNTRSTSALARDDAFTTPFQTLLNVGNLLTNDFGLNAGVPTISVATFGTTASLGTTTAAGSAGTTDAGGTLTVNADGTFSYQPPAGFSGNDQFMYIATTAVAGLPNNDAVVVITVQPGLPPNAVNDPNGGLPSNSTPPSGANPNPYHTEFNTLLNVPDGANDILANDNLGTPVAAIVSYGASTGLEQTSIGSATLTAMGGSVTVQANGSFSYTPAAGFTGLDNFKYRILNGAGSSIATVIIGVGFRPTAAVESYNVIGNVQIQPNAVQGILTNDGGSNLTVTAVNGSGANVGVMITTANGSNLTVNANGSFTYNPGPGYDGPTETFTYTAGNGFGSTASTTVTLNISGMVWFVANGGAAGDGRLATPFNSIAAFQGVNNGAGNNPAANDFIFVHESGSAYTGSLTLLSGQRLIGQDASASLSSITSLTPNATYSLQFPAMNATAGQTTTLTTTVAATNAINLGSGNTIRGLTIGNTTGAKIIGTGFGTLTLGNNTTPDIILNGSGQALNLTTGTFSATTGITSITSTSSGGTGISLAGVTGPGGTVNFGSTTISGSTTQGILIGTTTANINFGNTSITGGTDGLSLQNNSGGTKTFGTLSITTSGASGIVHGAGGGDLNVTGLTTITNPTGTGVDVSNLSTNPGNINFAGLTINKGATAGTGLNTSGTATGRTFTFGPLNITTSNGIAMAIVNGTYNVSSGTITAAGNSAINANLVTFAAGSALTAVNASGGTNPPIRFLASGGTLTINGGTLTGNNSSACVDIETGTINFTYNGAISQTTVGSVIFISGNTGGTIAFGGSVTGTNSQGINITGNNNTTVNFSGTSKALTTTTNNAVAFTSNTGTSAMNFSNGGLVINTTTGAGFTATGTGTATVTVNGGSNNTITKSGNGNAINISSVNAGGNGINFSSVNVTGGTGTAVTISTSTGTKSLGDVDVARSGGGTGIFASNAGTLNTTSGSINSGSLIAIDIDNTALGMVLERVDVNGGANGIDLSTTTGSFTVNGTGTTDGSGGTIQNTTGRGASFITATNITLKNMNFTNAGTSDLDATNGGLSTGDNLATNAAIHLQSVSTVTLDNINISGGAEQGINGNTVSSFSLLNSTITNVGNEPDEDNIHFYNMSGTSAITNTVLTHTSGGGDDNLNLQMQSGTLTLTISGGSAVGVTGGVNQLGSGYLFGIRGTANATITFNNASSTDNFSGGIVADAFDNSTMNLTITNSTSSGNNDQLSVSAGDNSNVDLTATGNTLSSVAIGDFVVVSLTGSALDNGYTFDATISNNTITVANGINGDGITVNNAGGGLLRTSITNNTFTYAGTQRVILVQGGTDGASQLNATITGNNIDIQLDGVGNAVTGILAQSQVASPSGNGSSLCVDIGGAGALRNIFTHSLGGSIAGGDIRVRQRSLGGAGSSTCRMPGYAGGAIPANAIAFLDGRNTVVAASTVTIDDNMGGGAACQQPN